MEVLNKAIVFATEQHKHQTRKGTVNGVKMPFIIHPMNVMKRVWRYGANEDVMAAAILHDTLEDCPNVTHDILTQEFGPTIAGYVLDLTFNPALITKPKYLETFRHKPIESLVIKVADRLSNTADFIDIGDTKYARKYFHKADDLFETLTKRTKEAANAFPLATKIHKDVAQTLRILEGNSP
jgi:(p)ppGpp synthase/HD superfamily hydrolase